VVIESEDPGVSPEGTGVVQPETSTENAEMGSEALPRELEQIFGFVSDEAARAALTTYGGEVVKYMAALKANPTMSDDEMERLKAPVHQALDALEEHKDKPGVRDATMAVVFYEMGHSRDQ